MSSTARGPRWRLAFIAVLALSAALLVAACGDDDDDGGGGGGDGGGDGYTMTLIAGVRGDEFYITMNCGAQEEARKQGVELDFQGPDEFDASQQTPIVNAVTQKKPDAILVAPTDTKAMYVPIKAAADAGITIVLVDTTLEQADLAVSQIASDNEAGGREAAKALADLIGGEGKVFVNNVNPASRPPTPAPRDSRTRPRTLGLDYVGMEYNDDDPAKAATIAKAQLAKNPDLAGIFGTNLFSAEGSATGVREAGKSGDVKIVGFDAGPKQMEDLDSGLIQALVAQKPADIGKLGVQQAVAALDGKPTKEQIGTDSVTLTKDNLEENPDIPYKSEC